MLDDEQHPEEEVGEEEINLNEILAIFKDEKTLENILSLFNETFPKLYKVLLTNRDSYLTEKIFEVTKKHQQIVVVLGYGHIHEVAKKLKRMDESLEIQIIN